MPGTDTTSRAEGPYRTATLSLPRVPPRRRWGLLALVAAVMVGGGVSRRVTAPAQEIARVLVAPPLVRRDVGPLRPLEGVMSLSEMNTPQGGSAIVARVRDGSLRRLPLDEDASPNPGLVAERVLAVPFVCTPRGAATGCFEPASAAQHPPAGVAVTPLAGNRLRLTCSDAYDTSPSWTLEGTSFASSDRAFCLRQDDGHARCFATVMEYREDERTREAGCESMQGSALVTPSPVLGMAVRDAEACAWTAGGALVCADLRYAEEPTRTGFREVGALPGIDRVRMGSTRGTLCARGRGGRVWCRGRWRPEVYEPGVDDERPAVVDAFAAAAPLQEVPELAGAEDILWTEYSACALLPRGRVACWGWNDRGQIADGSAFRRVTPGHVEALTPAAGISAGKEHLCAALRDGRVVCWGHNDHGQLGDGTLVPRGTPRPVALPAPAAQVAAGAEHTCARTTAGVWCWGEGHHGTLGDGEEHDARSPVRVAGLDDAVELSAGEDHTCARTASGEVYCWGRFGCGWPGEQRVRGALRPLRVEVGAPAVRLRSFGTFACAELTTGAVRCWGMQEHGGYPEAANGSCPREAVLFTPRRATLAGRESSWSASDLRTADDPEPRALDVADAVGVAEGEGFACALTRRGEVWCQGNNDHGQLGDGRTVLVTTPTLVLEALQAIEGREEGLAGPPRR